MKQSHMFAKLLALTCSALLVVGCSSSDGDEADATPLATSAPTTAAPTTTVDPLAALPTGVPGDLPNGVYRAETTDADLKAVNVPQDDWPEAHGTYTWTLQDGSWSFDQTAPNALAYPTGKGVYLVDGDHVTFLVPNDFGPQEFTWTTDADGSLVLTALPSTHNFFAAVLASHPLALVQ